MLASEKFSFLNSNLRRSFHLFQNFFSRHLSANVICSKEHGELT